MIMKPLRKLLAPAIVASMVAACQSAEDSGDYLAPDFKNESFLDFELLGDELMVVPANLKVTEDYVIITGFTRSTKETFYVFDKEGRQLRAGIYYGRGPAETTSGYINMTLYGDTVQYNDLQVGDRMSFSLKNFMSEETLAVNKEPLDMPEWCTFVSTAPNGEEIRVISRSRTKDLELPQRTLMIGSQEYTEQVFEDRDISFYSSLQTAIDYSPDGKKMVVSSIPGLTFEFFSLDNTVKRYSIKRLLPPSITIGGGTYQYNDDYIFGGGNMCTTDKFIYSAYDGEHTGREWRAARDTCLLYRNIAVFDWAGKPQHLYKTKYRIMNICVEQNSSTAYATLEDREGRYFLGKAKLK